MSEFEYPIGHKAEARINYFKEHGCTIEWAFALMLLERIEILEDKITRINDLEARLKRLEEKIKMLKDRDDYLSDDQFPMDLRL